MLNMGLPEPIDVQTEDHAREVLEHVLSLTHVGLDTETTGLELLRDYPIYWSLSDGKHRWGLEEHLLEMFLPFFEAEHITKILTNAKFDKHMLANLGIDLRGPLWDTVVMGWLINVNGQHDLKSDMTRNYRLLPPDAMPSFRKVFLTDEETGKTRNMKKGENVGDLFLQALEEQREKAVEYATKDAWASYVLAMKMKERLERISFGDDWTGWDHYVTVEVPFTPVLWRAERRGITVDLGHLDELAIELTDEMDKTLREFTQAAGRMVNVNSPPQVREVFYLYDEDANEWLDPWDRPCRYWTKGGKSGNRMPSTDKRALETWAEEGITEAQLILDYRAVSKLHDTYVKKMGPRLDGQMRVHTSLNQAGTQTGRLSSSGPNLQNIPVRSEQGKRIREAFVAGEGKRLLVFDYSQLEMRILAHMSRDKGMIDAINAGMDIHCDTAHRATGRPYEEYAEAKAAEKPTPEQEERLKERSVNKNAGFLIVYGGGPRKLTHTAGISLKKAKEVIEGFKAARPGIALYADAMKALAHDKKHVQTLVGRYRHLPFIDSDQDHGASERAAVNTPIQGSAADIIKAAMLKLFAIEDPRFHETAQLLADYECELLLQVHDELVFEIPDSDEVEAAVTPVIRECMEHPFNQDLVVPLPIDGGSGYSWVAAK